MPTIIVPNNNNNIVDKSRQAARFYCTVNASADETTNAPAPFAFVSVAYDSANTAVVVTNNNFDSDSVETRQVLYIRTLLGNELDPDPNPDTDNGTLTISLDGDPLPFTFEFELLNINDLM